MEKYFVTEGDKTYEVLDYSRTLYGPISRALYGPKIDDRVYYYKNKLHREHGPARTIDNEWYYDGIYYPDINSYEELMIAIIII